MGALEPASFLGLGCVAVWLYVRYPGLRPSTMTRAIAHVAVSFGVFSLVPYGVDPCIAYLPDPLSVLTVVCGMLVPTMTYVLLSWIWLIARLHELGNTTPRGGHRVRTSEA